MTSFYWYELRSTLIVFYFMRGEFTAAIPHVEGSLGSVSRKLSLTSPSLTVPPYRERYDSACSTGLCLCGGMSRIREP
jgi:hypothetical protein